MPATDNVYTLEQAAEYLGITVGGLKNAVYKFKIIPVNRNDRTLSRDWCFTRAALDKRKATAGEKRNNGWRGQNAERFERQFRKRRMEEQ